MMPAPDLPRMVQVKSSNVEAVGHDAKRGELHVRFKGGSHYVYQGVPPTVHAELMGAESAGKFIAANVRAKFSHRKL